MVTEEERGPWETESGLVDDVDAWIANPHFGVKEEYSQVVVETTGGTQRGVMLLIDLIDENGEIIGNQGYSIGTGWEVSEDGLTISHAKRQNVIGSTLYGQLQHRVCKDLGIKMQDYGLPIEALSWDGLGFHWVQQAHSTVGGEEKTGLMPTEFISRIGDEEAAATAPVVPVAPVAPVAPARPAARPAARPVVRPAPATTVSAGEAAALQLVTETGTVKEFILKAVKVPEIAADDALMARCLDDSPTGFFRQNKA